MTKQQSLRIYRNVENQQHRSSSLRGGTPLRQSWKLWIPIFMGMTIAVFAVAKTAPIPTAHAAQGLQAPANNLGLVGYWSMEDATGTKVMDFSGNGNTGTATNFAMSGTTSNWVAGKRGKALNFDGTDDYVDAGTISQTGAISISLWAKFNGFSSFNDMVSNYDSGATKVQYEFTIGTNNTLWFESQNGAGNYKYWKTSDNAVTTGQWYHLAVTHDGTLADSGVKLYINGSNQSITPTTVGSPTMPTSGFGKTSIGRPGEYNGSYTNGLLDDVRIFNRTLSASEVANLYGVRQVRYTNSTSNNGLVGYWSMEDAAGTKVTDFSGNGNTGTATNFAMSGATSNWVAGKRGKALSFDGTDDYISIGSTAPFSLTTNFTVSAWIKMNSTASNQAIYDSGTNTNHWFVSVGSNGKLRFTERAIADYDANTTLTTGVWYNVSVVKSGDSGANVTFYVNGTSDGTASVGTVAAPSGNGTIGDWTDTFAHLYWNGLIDDVRVYNRALSATEIAGLYSSGQQRINAPNNSGLVAYYNMEDATGTKATDFSGNGNVGTLTNGPTWVSGKFGKALSFDGVDDYVAGTTPSLNGLAAASISAWVKTQTSQTNTYIVAQPFVSSGSNGFDINFVDSTHIGSWLKTTNATAGTGGVVQCAITYTDGNWHHIIATYNGTTHTIYCDGVQGTSVSRTTSIVTIGNEFYIGRFGSFGAYASGSIDDVRIYNRALSATEVSNLYNTGR